MKTKRRETVLNALGEPIKDIILNSSGEPIILSAHEQVAANQLQRIYNSYRNALGFELNITSLTTIMKKVSEQKFFEIPFAQYLPVRVGEGAFSSNLVTYRSFAAGDDFSTGIINTGGNSARLASADVGVDSLSIKVYNWAKAIGWTLFELELAAKSGNWDLIVEKEKSRKKNWDLGLQKLAFLGMNGDSSCLGLLNQSGATVDTTNLTKALNTMTPTELSTFCQVILNVYRTACNRSAWPTHFIIPESDYLGLATPTSPTYPIKSMLQLLEETFKIMTKNQNFQILPCAYADKAYSGYSQAVYTLLNYDESSIRMDVPVDYTNTMQNTLNGFSFEAAAYGQFTGVLAYRPLELYYLKF
jgi:hypothetical protein